MKLSDLDPKDIEVVSEPEGSSLKLSDLNDTDYEVVEEASAPEISKIDSAIEGGRQGITLGLSDEGSGAFGAGADAVQSLLNKLGIAGKSPSQVNAELAEQGFTGDVGPTTSMDTYREFRDEDRAKMRAAQEANPMSFLAGGVAGGLASTPLLPTGMLAPVKVAKDATLAAKVGAGAMNAVPMGATMGLTMGESDLTQGDVGGAIKDTATGVVTSAGVGGTLPVVGAALKGVGNVASRMIPDTTKTAFNRGLEGIKTTGQEFYEDVTGRLSDVADDISGVVSKKVSKQQADQASRVAEIEKNLLASQDEAMKLGELEKARQIASNAQEVNQINKETVGTAKKLQSQIFGVKKQLGKEFDDVDQAAAAAGIFPENRDVIGTFLETINSNSTLPESQLNGFTKKLQPFLGDKSPTAYRQLKKELNGLMSHGDPTVRKAAKDAFIGLKNNYKNELLNNGFEGIANRIDAVNKRWSSAIDLEDKFLSNLKPDRITGEIEASPDTIRAISTFGEKNPVQMAENQRMSKLLNVLDPEGAPNMIGEMQSLADRAAKAKAFEPQVQTTNPEIQRLEALLKNVKGQNQQATQIPGLNLNQMDDQIAVQDQLKTLLPKQGMQTGDDLAEGRLKEVFDFMGKERGEQATEQLKEKVGTLSKDVALRNLRNQPTDSIPTGIGGVVNKVLGGTADAANVVGRASKNVNDVLQNGVRKLSEATPDQVRALGQKLTFMGKEGQAYARILDQATSANKQSRDAIIFGLMQRPEFRQMLEKVGTEEDNGELK